ncbi:hypothetical protein PIB30_000566 [Stylosanthes scabra]|uniref:Uncharacterized protein n=1 Tax=Stylosanthes scabra TaxID=79078 RepID=A0ABU6X469_9FABA|nr:hypothetical protein [Stylosanthes scabra]
MLIAILAPTCGGKVAVLRSPYPSFTSHDSLSQRAVPTAALLFSSPLQEAVTRLSGSSEHLDGYRSIGLNQQKYEIADDMVIKLSVIAENVCCQTSVRSIVLPHFPQTLPLPECPSLITRPLRALRAAASFALFPPRTRKCIQVQVR